MVTTLYRHYDGDGVLLYVGISLSALGRLLDHRKEACWYGDIITIKLEHFSDRPTALQAEAVAIQTENPLYNYHWCKENKRKYPPVKKRREWHLCKGCGILLEPEKGTACEPCYVKHQKEIKAAQQKRYRERHPKRSTAYSRIWRARNPDTVAAFNLRRKHAYKGPRETKEERRERYLRDKTSKQAVQLQML